MDEETYLSDPGSSYSLRKRAVLVAVKHFFSCATDAHIRFWYTANGACAVNWGNHYLLVTWPSRCAAGAAMKALVFQIIEL